MINWCEARFCLLIIVFIIQNVVGNHIQECNDQIWFTMKWGEDQTDLLSSSNYEKTTIMSANQEEFQCFIPLKQEETNDDISEYKGSGPLSLLLPALKDKAKACSMKIEPYWTYELCHGVHIKQYNPDQKSATNENVNYLGYINPVKLAELELLAKKEDLNGFSKPHHIKIETKDFPYYPITYTDGTPCKPLGSDIRHTTTVMYTCLEKTKNQIYSIKEVSTCIYEIVVFNSDLCEHPMFKPKPFPELPIHCSRKDAGPSKPLELLEIEAASNPDAVAPCENRINPPFPRYSINPPPCCTRY